MASKDKLEHLKAAINSTSVNQASIVVDATRYIEDLKGRVQKMNEDVETLESSCHQDDLPVKVRVENQEKGFLIKVFSEKNCPGLLVSILEAFEELGLDVLDAMVSCSDNFRLEAISESEGQSDSIDACTVKQAVLQAIRNWNEKNNQD